MPGYSAERYRQNPPAIGCVLKYYSKEDTDAIVEVFKRVGRTHFSYPDVSDLLPNYMALRRMKTDGIIELVRRRHNYVNWWIRGGGSLIPETSVQGVIV